MSEPIQHPRSHLELKLDAIARRHEIRPEFCRRLKKLRGFEIAIVCDDSGSMNTLINGTRQTRWEYLMEIVTIILEISVLFDINGVDIYFLNRDGTRNIKDPGHIRTLFHDLPAGYTPLIPVLQQVFRHPATALGHEKKLLIFVATDGAPTDDFGYDQTRELEMLLRDQRRAETTHVQFLACTDEDAQLNYMNGWDRTMKNVDVTRDFNRERAAFRQKFGSNEPFSKGDYIVKALLGAIDEEIDKWDGS